MSEHSVRHLQAVVCPLPAPMKLDPALDLFEYTEEAEAV